MEKIPPKILEYIAIKNPTDFIKTSWNNMTSEKFKSEVNPFMQLEYLIKFGPNYYTTTKYKQLYTLITNPFVLSSPRYTSLKFKSDVPITPSIKECLKKHGINDLVDIALKKFGGNRNSYLTMTHDALLQFDRKKHVVIQTRKIQVNRHNVIDDAEYSKMLEKQIKYVDSLNPEVKSGLQKYTHQFDWKVNQVLMADKPIVESLKHPNPTDNFDVEEDLTYGYTHVFNKNITDVQRHVDAAFAHVPPLDHALVVYRGIRYKGETYTHDPIYNKQYISTTTKIGNANEFLGGSSCCILHITLPKGTHVLPLQRVTLHEDEFEVLLPRNGELQVYKQVGNNVYAHFNDKINVTKKPLRVFDEHTTAINIKLTMPKYVHSIVAGTMGPGRFDGKQYIYTLKHPGLPYIPKKLPYIIMLKKLTKDYPDARVIYNAITNKGVHVLDIHDGNIFENGHVVKFTGGIGGGVVIGKNAPNQPIKENTPNKPIKENSAPGCDSKSADSADKWQYTKIKPGGGNEGAIYKDDKGVEWLVKFSNNPNMICNEILANQLYKALGIPVPVLKAVNLKGRFAIASKMLPNVHATDTPAEWKLAWPGFAADVWLRNWDAATYSNLITSGNQVYRIDTGGALVYRAVGGKKPGTPSTDVSMSEMTICYATLK